MKRLSYTLLLATLAFVVLLSIVFTWINYYQNNKTNIYPYLVAIASILIFFVILLKRYTIRFSSISSLKSELLFKSLLESAPDAMIIIDEKGSIILVNQQTEKLFGYKREELINQRVEILIPKELRNTHVRHRNDYNKEPRVRAMGAGLELQAIKKNGEKFPVEISLSPLETRETRFVSASVRDITDRKKVQEALVKLNEELEHRVTERTEALLASEILLQSSIESSKNMIMFSVDIEYKYLYFNSAHKTSMKNVYKENINIGGSLLDYITVEEDKLKMKNNISLALKGRSHITVEKFGDIQEDYYESRYNPVYNKDNKVIGVTVFTFNITDRVLAEQALKRNEAELEEKVNQRTAQLEASTREMEAFTYSVSHDLRAPLRGIIGFTSILEEEYGNKLDEEGKRITSVIKNNTIKMGHLIDELLNFSRVGKQEINKSHTNTNQLVRDIVENLEVKNKKTKWTIFDLPAVKADVNTLRQVWINLIANALKYSAKKEIPIIEIGHHGRPAEDIFFVKDNGVGFDEQYGNKLFKVFQRLHSPKDFEGTGVGLAIVEKIVNKHGGRVWAQGEVDKGATFYFSLPKY